MLHNSYPLALQAAVAGHGVALGWSRTTEGMIAYGKLIQRRQEQVERPTELSVFRSTARDPHPDTERFIEWIVRNCRLRSLAHFA